MLSLSKRQFTGWCLFDFANSFLIINGGLYFPQWVVIDNGISDFWFNLTITLSSLFLIVSAPVLGLLSDKRLGRVFFLRLISLIMFLAALLIGIAAIAISDRMTRVTVGLASFFMIMYGYQLSLVFYNVILGRLTTPERYGRVSGFGLAAGWAGGIVGILAVLPFVEGNVPFFQPAGRVQAFIPSAIFYAILTAVSLALLRKDPPSEPIEADLTFKHMYKETFSDIRKIVHQRNIWFFLLSYFLFSDAVLTVQNNSTIYLENVMGFSDTVKAQLFLLLLVMSAVGGIASGFLADIFGHKRTLLWVLISWVAVLTAMGVTTHETTFIVLFGVIGILFGAIWNVSRAFFLVLSPPQRRGEYFGVYSSYERLASVFGPLVWSIPVVFLAGMGPARYQFALETMAFLLLISIIMLLKIRLPSATSKVG